MLKPSLPKPQTWLVALLGFQLILWTIAPLLVPYVPALDAIEMHSWSLAPQWGYYKHPPLPAWVIAISTTLFGKTQFALTLPSTLCIALTYWAIWRLASKMLPPKAAVITVLFSAATFFYHIWATGFNHNVVQIPAWAWAITLLYEVLTDKKVSVLAWIRLGLVFASALLAKYTAVLLLPAWLLLLLLIPPYRKQIQLPLLLAGAFGCAVIFIPHFLWLLQHDFQPLHYASARLAEGHQSLNQHNTHNIWNAHWGRQLAGFIGTLLLGYCVSIILLGWRLIQSRRLPTLPLVYEETADADQNSYLLVDYKLQHLFLAVMTFCPLALAVLLGLSGQTLAPMWGMAMLPMLPLFLIQYYFYRACRHQHHARAHLFIQSFYQRGWLYAWIIFQLLCVSAFLLKGSPLYQQFSTRSIRANYPAQALTSAITEKWQTQFPAQRLSYIAGPLWEAGVISFYSKDTPMVLPDGDFTAAPWITLEQVKKCGIVLIEPSPMTLTQFPAAQIQVPLTLPMLKGKPPLTLKWAMVAPLDPNHCHR